MKSSASECKATYVNLNKFNELLKHQKEQEIEKHVRLLVGMTDKGSVGGPAACEPPFVAGLRALGVEVEEEIYAYGDRFSGPSLPKRVSRVLQTARKFRKRLDAERFDVVHLNTSFDTKALLRDVTVIQLLRSAGAKIFLKFHGSDARLLRTRNRALHLLEHRLLKQVDGIGLLSSEEKSYFICAGADERKTFVVKNLVERNEEKRTAQFVEEINVAPDVPLLLFIARFIPAKGLLDVIRTCSILRERGLKFMLLCVGDGMLRATAEKLVAALELQSHVHFTGYISEEEAKKFYANSTALLFPTYHFEGFPMVIFNAVAAGLPIITTRIRAAADYLHEPDNCLWVEPKNPEMLAAKVVSLLNNSRMREMISSNNRKLAQKFTAREVVPEYLEIYERLIKWKRGG